MFFATLLVSLVGFLATLMLSVRARLASGASWDELRTTRFFEVVPIRALLWGLLGLAWVAWILDLLVLLFRTLGLFGAGRSLRDIAVLLVAALLAWPLYKLRVWVKKRLVDLPRIEPPPAGIAEAQFHSSIPGEDFAVLGCERFPNHVAPSRQADQYIRWAILAVSGIVVLLVICGISNSENQGSKSSKDAPSAGLSTAAAVRGNFGTLLALFSVTPLGILLYNNRDYTFVPFRPALVAQAGLILFIVVGLALAGASSDAVLLTLAATCAACGARALIDLRTAWRYDRTKRVYNPIADALGEWMPYLSQIPKHPGFQLAALSVDALHERITRGCKNVEERGLLVTRHFSRFLRLVDVHYQDCAMAMLRYLTWRRYVTLSGGMATWLGLRHPEVPWWDLQLFPLRPPAGFVNRLDPLGLGEEYNVVAVCGGCGGLGQVTRTVTEYRTAYYTDSNGQSQSRQVAESRQVQETCSSCTGSGRLLHQQILNTQWQRLLPLVTHPDMRVPELVEDAEDATYVHLPLTENQKPLTRTLKCAVPRSPLLEQIHGTCRHVVTAHDERVRMVEKLHDGHLYRADFQVCGFRTICIRFVRLRGRIGWLFGRRPEFYFPRLPLAWSVVATCVFLPPLALTTAAAVLGLALLMLKTGG